MIARGFVLRVGRRILFNSLYTAMKKAKTRFRKAGEGLWTLADRPESPVDEDEPEDFDFDEIAEADIEAVNREIELERESKQPTYAESAETVIRLKSRPVRTGEVADWIIRNGYRPADKKKHICNTLFNCMNSSPKFVKVGVGLWDLVDRDRTGREVNVGVSRNESHVTLFKDQGMI